MIEPHDRCRIYPTITVVFRMFGSVDQNPDTSPVVTEVLGKTFEVPPGTKKEFKESIQMEEFDVHFMDHVTTLKPVT
ncbi:hypothetical protein TELCIR_15122 [Teladorsagia circumcincta]|uniref:Uncharacterized protein n=1 Tax=Teladorsagia circumcincta TaxID=45464 RepID=A0A2G9TZ17_TELCI|nr:hypothetical protein TELCIR_15122 [Teladorsagia circumcincta]